MTEDAFLVAKIEREKRHKEREKEKKRHKSSHKSSKHKDHHKSDRKDRDRHHFLGKFTGTRKICLI